MPELLKKIAEWVGIDPLVTLVITAILSIFGASLTFAYKENLFGLRNKIRKLFRAEPEDKLDNPLKGKEVDKEDVPDIASTQPAIESVVISTSPVYFKNERLVNDLDLQRAVHVITRSENAHRIPLEYDARVAFLRQKVENLYEHYEYKIREAGGEGSLEDLSTLRGTIDFARDSLNSLPRTVGLVAKRLSCERKELNDVGITKACSRFVELRMTQILASLVRYQFDAESPILKDYAKLGSYQEYVALVDGIALDSIVSYRIQFAGDYDDRIVFAPGEYGHKWLLVLAEFDARGRDYIPPLSFMTEYCYPQMLLWLVDDPNRWNFEWKCQSVNVKDLRGNYISEYFHGSHEEPIE